MIYLVTVWGVSAIFDCRGSMLPPIRQKQRSIFSCIGQSIESARFPKYSDFHRARMIISSLNSLSLFQTTTCKYKTKVCKMIKSKSMSTHRSQGIQVRKGPKMFIAICLIAIGKGGIKKRPEKGGHTYVWPLLASSVYAVLCFSSAKLTN